MGEWLFRSAVKASGEHGQPDQNRGTYRGTPHHVPRLTGEHPFIPPEPCPMLTDAHCRNATCPPDKKRARFTDAAGLYLEVSPTGFKRWFWKIYTDGKESRLALGSYPAVSLSTARQARDAAKKKRAEGTDLVLARKIEKLKEQRNIHASI